MTNELSSSHYPNLKFWLAFIGFNLLLFVPLYLLTIESNSFFPQTEHPILTWAAFKSLFQYRNNFDIFRFNVELPVILTLWLLIRPLRRPSIKLVCILLSLLFLYYYIYEAVTTSIFLVDPIFYNQYLMARDGLGFLLQHVDLPWWLYVGAVFLFMVVNVLIVQLLRILYSINNPTRLHWSSKLLMIIILGLGLASVWRFKIALANPVMVASSITYKLQKNVKDSLAIAESVAAYEHEHITQVYNFDQYNLQQKPDIYFLLLESYGSVLYKRPHFRSDYLAILARLEQQLADEHWHSASNFSTAPTWGGGSWMSYASLLFGLHIDSHPQFLFLRNRYQFETYPDIGHFLKNQGYHYFRISSLAIEMTTPEWQQYINFYGVDTWLRFRDMNYSGTRYSWGPSPPDQYTMGFIQQEMEQRAPDQPHVMFFITQNSHYPWTPLPPVLDDWRQFNEQPVDGILPAGELTGLDAQRQNYLWAIVYELTAMVDFITRQEDKNAIFILVGDHQPPRVARRNDGFETPMHIISGDPALLEGLKEYGFEAGLQVVDQTNPIKHAGFLSLFSRLLVEHYGDGQSQPPPYLPDGIRFSTDE